MLQVYRTAPDAKIMVICSRCVTAWRADDGTVAGIGLTIDLALSHVCDTSRPSMAPVRYRPPTPPVEDHGLYDDQRGRGARG
jgi:hypothetical protein